MQDSSFYRDGYKDGIEGNKFSAPDASIYAMEYQDGYEDGISNAPGGCILQSRGRETAIKPNNKRRKTMAIVFHEERQGEKIFLCISIPKISGLESMKEAGNKCYGVEREIDPDNCTPESVSMLIRDMEKESGLSLEPSDLLKEIFGF